MIKTTRLLRQQVPPRECLTYCCGTVPYETAWQWQQRLIRERWSSRRGEEDTNQPDVLLVLQHPSVYTLGRRASLNHLKFNPDSTPHHVVRVDRGGDVTYHGPGQLVLYPILDLQQTPHRKDLHWYLRQIEQVVIDTLKEFDVDAERVEGLTGVWTKKGTTKIAAVGTHASKWITMHGLALNVTTDLSAFDEIVPCGISDKRVSSLQQFVPGIQLDDVQEAAIRAFANVFDVSIRRMEGVRTPHFAADL